jgi:type I restriction enzyme, S subunit
MSTLPSGWTEATLGEVCAKPQYGWTTKADPGGAGLRLLRTTDITPGAIDWSRVPFCSEPPGDPTKYLLTPNDIVISRAGSVGVSALVGECPPAVFASYLIRFRALSGIESSYLSWFLKSPTYWEQVAQSAAGIALQNINAKKLEAISLPLAPASEQRRIVAEIEEQMSRLDAAERMVADVRNRLRQLRSVVLSSLLGGPWPLARIGDVASVGGGATPKRDHADYWENGTIPWVTSGQLTEPFVRAPAALITEKALCETSVKPWPKHTLLVALYGEGKTRGHCSELLIEATTNQACAAILLKDDSVDRAYLKLFFAASYDAHRRLASGGVQPNLSLGLIKNLMFPLPPIDEQRRIVAETEQRLSLIDALAVEVARATSRSAVLRRSVLGRAYTGRLVPQDSADEPASALLQRIAAMRRMTTKSPRSRRRSVPA